MAETKISEVIDTSLQKIKEFATSETVIGDPITTSTGVTIIPVSKVSMGFATGGLDFSGKKDEKALSKQPHFGGGGGTGVNITPVAFLIISASGNVELMPITSPSNVGTVDKVTNLLERTPDIVQKLKDVFTSKKPAYAEATDSLMEEVAEAEETADE